MKIEINAQIEREVEYLSKVSVELTANTSNYYKIQKNIQNIVKRYKKLYGITYSIPYSYSKMLEQYELKITAVKFCDRMYEYGKIYEYGKYKAILKHELDES